MTDWGIDSGHITTRVRDDVAVVTLHRPDKLNALTTEMRRELAAIVRHFGDGSRADGIVVTGSGRAFSAGEDLRQAAELLPGGFVEEVEVFHDMTRAVLETRVPVVAAVNGIAVGGAFEWTLCFDARIGSPAAEFFLPENGIGLPVSNAAGLLLPRLTGGGRALRLVLDTARLGAEEAVAAGLLDEIVPADGLVDAAVGLVRRWSRPGSATAVHLALLRPSLEDVERAFAAETRAAGQVDESGLARSGVNAFLSRRAARST
ncbi:enoyl-CoA hydratase [Thermocatellispora tengchongensis]|uniref:Enoyl-CoA hydratase n=1 Tax=Thermocatellispora tengchongensis TaxID=1073253 RepID=A0A840PEJ7_9ACTN|nr:enoyl-CoA hydratase/isomerase family protein [Thermocatellispora tengchongensis]MBB5135880.1 enoyl-CoA hydratase [Thermocatellispora tengchongensis]